MKVKIGTHSGAFHADETLAVYMLKMLPLFKEAQVVRSRNQAVLEPCHVVVDVGGVYDGVKYFDHHQKGFDQVFSPAYTTKLSSAGLIFKHFGQELICEFAKSHGKAVTDKDLAVLHDKTYSEFMEAIDANDNGISAYSSEHASFNTSGITLPKLVANLNPVWTHPRCDDDTYIDEQFAKASRLMGEALEGVLSHLILGWLPAKSLVQRAFDSRLKHDPSGRIMVFETRVPWKDHLFQIEQDCGQPGSIKYVVYGEGKDWRVQAVPLSSTSFESRKPLPEPWRGLRDSALQAVCGVPGCVFVHASGFIGGNQTQDGAFEMARLASDYE